MLMAMALLSTMDAMAKSLTMDGVSVIQILALRSVIIVPVLFLGFAIAGKSTQLKPKNNKAHLWRGLIGFLAPFSFFLGITHIPLTDAVVIFFSSIFFITLLSGTYLGEKVGVHRWGSVIVGFVGVLLVIGPTGGGSFKGYALVLAGSAAYSVLFVSGRRLSATETVASLVISYNMCVGCVSLLLLPWFWTELSIALVLRIVVLALFALAGHYLVTLAFSRAEASLLAPFEYSCVIWAIAFDLLVWKLYPAPVTLFGALIIIASGLYITHREKLRDKGLH